MLIRTTNIENLIIPYRHYQIGGLIPDVVHQRRDWIHFHEVGGVRMEEVRHAGRIGHLTVEPHPIFIWVKDDRHPVVQWLYEPI